MGESEAPSGGRKWTKLELVQRLEAGGPVLILGFPRRGWGSEGRGPLAFQHFLLS